MSHDSNQFFSYTQADLPFGFDGKTLLPPAAVGVRFVPRVVGDRFGCLSVRQPISQPEKGRFDSFVDVPGELCVFGIGDLVHVDFEGTEKDRVNRAVVSKEAAKPLEHVVGEFVCATHFEGSSRNAHELNPYNLGYSYARIHGR